MPPGRSSWNDRHMPRTRIDERTYETAGPRLGWIFDVEGRHPGAPTHAEILEILDVPGYAIYRVRWDDGSETTFVPSHDTHAHPARSGRCEASRVRP